MFLQSRITTDLSQRCGFPVRGGFEFKLCDRPYRISASGIRTLRLLGEIYDAARTRKDRNWLVRLRDRIRQVQSYSATSVLCLVVERTNDPLLRILAIWLRGRCGGSLGTASLARLCTDPDDQTRKVVAHALVRMHAWQVLGRMARHDPTAQIRRIATPMTPRPFSHRLAHCLHHFNSHGVRICEARLYVAPHVSMHHGRRPKSPAVIRAILERIHRIVAGGA